MRGEAGLVDRARTPHHSPRATSSAVISKILYLWQNYHFYLWQNYHFGAGRIAAYLQRFHQVEIARSTGHRILIENGMGRLPANQKHHDRTATGGKATRRFSLGTACKWTLRNCVNGRTTTIIIVRTGRCRVGPRMND